MSTSDVPDNHYAEREAYIRATLESNNLIPHLMQRALERGFSENAAAVTYIIGEIARDDTTYEAAVAGHYEPEQYSLLADIYLARLQEKLARRQTDAPSEHRR